MTRRRTRKSTLGTWLAFWIGVANVVGILAYAGTASLVMWLDEVYEDDGDSPPDGFDSEDAAELATALHAHGQDQGAALALCADLQRSRSPLIAGLLDQGLLAPDPLRLGLNAPLADTSALFSRPRETRTADYIAGRFG